MTDLKSAGANPKWGASADSLSRRSVFQVCELGLLPVKHTVVSYFYLHLSDCRHWYHGTSDDMDHSKVFLNSVLKYIQGELRQVGIKNPEKIAIPSIRNDAAFLVTVTRTLQTFVRFTL